VAVRTILAGWDFLGTDAQDASDRLANLSCETTKESQPSLMELKHEEERIRSIRPRSGASV
jgi:hypothetical protein